MVFPAGGCKGKAYPDKYHEGQFDVMRGINEPRERLLVSGPSITFKCAIVSLSPRQHERYKHLIKYYPLDRELPLSVGNQRGSRLDQGNQLNQCRYSVVEIKRGRMQNQ